MKGFLWANVAHLTDVWVIWHNGWYSWTLYHLAINSL